MNFFEERSRSVSEEFYHLSDDRQQNVSNVVKVAAEVISSSNHNMQQSFEFEAPNQRTYFSVPYSYNELYGASELQQNKSQDVVDQVESIEEEKIERNDVFLAPPSLVNREEGSDLVNERPFIVHPPSSSFESELDQISAVCEEIFVFENLCNQHVSYKRKNNPDHAAQPTLKKKRNLDEAAQRKAIRAEVRRANLREKAEIAERKKMERMKMREEVKRLKEIKDSGGFLCGGDELILENFERKKNEKKEEKKKVLEKAESLKWIEGSSYFLSAEDKKVLEKAKKFERKIRVKEEAAKLKRLSSEEIKRQEQKKEKTKERSRINYLSKEEKKVKILEQAESLKKSKEPLTEGSQAILKRAAIIESQKEMSEFLLRLAHS